MEKVPCPQGGYHEWKIDDYTDTCGNLGTCVVMRGPVCAKCGAIGEYVLSGGWQQATSMTAKHALKHVKEKIKKAKIKRSPKTLKLLRKAAQHLHEADRLARDNRKKKQP